MSELALLLQEIPDVQLRLAITGAIFMAADNLEAFEKRYGTYGVQGLKRLMKGEKKC